MMNINKHLTPYNFKDYNSTDRIKYIVIHYVGALGGAEDNCIYYASQYVGASAHYYCGFNGEIWQSVEDEDIAWHCGASTYIHPYCRNTNSIGIELCVRKRNTSSMGAEDTDWYFEQATVDTAAQLTKSLMAKYNIPAANVIRHNDVTGKCCPNPYVVHQGAWQGFKAALTGTAGTKPIQPPVTSSTNNIQPPKTSADSWILQLQQELNKEWGGKLVEDGIAGALTLAACPLIKQGSRGSIIKLIQERFGFTSPDDDGIFGASTAAHTKAYQTAKGLDADGIIGKDTWSALLYQ